MWLVEAIAVWQGISTNSLKFHPGPSCPTLLRPAGGPSPKRPYGCFWGGLRPFSTPLDTPAVRAWLKQPDYQEVSDNGSAQRYHSLFSFNLLFLEEKII
jgi:hypothetical protein